MPMHLTTDHLFIVNPRMNPTSNQLMWHVNREKARGHRQQDYQQSTSFQINKWTQILLCKTGMHKQQEWFDKFSSWKKIEQNKNPQAGIMKIVSIQSLININAFFFIFSWEN